ncbi:peptidase M1 [Desulfosarcina widdelii]|uniref:Peptidase M1 n=1 Tax=Desulfosarcina widdelii TaxID=947919 RepID=A0A5K7ZHH9_9BACT|nr:M1 family aminopeptidase [Desulfosarcina widdelii]BBO75537.1 peptidase M1 [Desulfosarcina widdelii]
MMTSDSRHPHPLSTLRLVFVAALAGLWILFAAAVDSAAQQTLHHELEVEILHDAKTLRGKDTIRFPRGASRLRVAFRPDVRILGVKGATYTQKKGVLDLNLEAADPSSNTVVLRYEGVFDDPFEAEPFSMDNPGQGVMGTITGYAAFFLAGSGWYPVILEDIPETFRVSVTAPRGIYAVMEGRLETHADDGDRSLSIWSVARPSGPLAMFAGRYVVNERMHGKVRIATYFFPANAGLSTRYLDAVQRHISRYEALHGPYPFAKFAVVENFFPTGYGFPSFTLLGSRVLRLPFIPDTSLRHEVAHCWWGNGVLVDAAGGNWCEGLTTYVADYLSKEEDSFEQARGYRLRTLEKYALLAAGEKDFPLSNFRSRYNPASQAVGYGKAMFVFHMMRLRIGDAAFWAALRDIYGERLYKKTNWGHFMDAFAEHGGLDQDAVRTFYDQWITRPGALQLAMDRPRVVTAAGRTQVEGVLIQKSPRYNVRVPLEVAGATVKQRENVPLDGATAKFSIRMQQAPRTVAADPDFDVFRLLYPEEIPATVNAVKGSGALAAVLAEDSPEPWAQIFRGLLMGLNHGGTPVWRESRFAAEDTAGADVLFFGMPKREKGRNLLSELGDAVLLSSRAFQVGKDISSRNADTLFAVFKKNQRLVAVFLPVAGTDVETVVRTARKITHYGRYGRLSFKGGVNTGKGVGEVSGSPLVVDLGDNS